MWAGEEIYFINKLALSSMTYHLPMIPLSNPKMPCGNSVRRNSKSTATSSIVVLSVLRSIREGLQRFIPNCFNLLKSRQCTIIKSLSFLSTNDSLESTRFIRHQFNGSKKKTILRTKKKLSKENVKKVDNKNVTFERRSGPRQLGCTLSTSFSAYWHDKARQLE